MVDVGCPLFVDDVIERMRWGELFKACPLLRPTLQLATAIGYEKYLRGDFGPMPAATSFADAVVSIAANDLGREIDLIDAEAWARLEIQEAFHDAVRVSFDNFLKGPEVPIQVPQWRRDELRERAALLERHRQSLRLRYLKTKE